MILDIPSMAQKDAYKILSNLVVPRPIALVTTLNVKGTVNAAPFSFFNLLGSNPPMCALGIAPTPAGALKHTARNIDAIKQFVVNIVTEEIAEAMNICAIDFPDEESELPAAGLTAAPGSKVVVPHIAESLASLECTLMSVQTLGKNRVIFGEIVAVHIRDDLFNPVTKYVAHEKMNVVGRMGSPNWYTHTRDQFEMTRMSYDEYKSGLKGE